MDQADITMAHISADGIHLNSHGTSILLYNISSVFNTFDGNSIDFIKDYEYAKSLSWPSIVGVGIEVSDGRGDKEIVANTNDQGNGFVENIVQEKNPSVDGTLISAPLIPPDKHLESNLTNKAPLRLTGGGDTSFESLEEISLENPGNSHLENSISDSKM